MRITSIVMLLFVLVISSCTPDGVSNNKSWIQDNEDILTAQQESQLNALISKYEKKTSNEIMIVTSKEIGEFEGPVSYAADILNTNNLGKEGKENGLVIFFSKELGLVSLAPGYGSEMSLTDSVCKVIVNSYMTPHFKEGKYYEGIKAGVKQSIRRWE